MASSRLTYIERNKPRGKEAASLCSKMSLVSGTIVSDNGGERHNSGHDDYDDDDDNDDGDGDEADDDGGSGGDGDELRV